MIELESDFVVVHCVALDVFEFLPNKCVNFETFRLLFWDFINNMFPGVNFLSTLKFLVKNLDLLCSFLTEDGWYLGKELFGHRVIGRFFLLLDKLCSRGIIFDDYKFGVYVDLIDNKVRKHVLGNGRNLLTRGDVLLDTHSELLWWVKNWNL